MVEIALGAEAETDIRKAVRYYESEEKGLGRTFLDAFDRSLEYIARHPKLYRTIHKNFRRCILRKFPYQIVYRLDELEKSAIVIAVIHQRRKPENWLDRV